MSSLEVRLARAAVHLPEPDPAAVAASWEQIVSSLGETAGEVAPNTRRVKSRPGLRRWFPRIVSASALASGGVAAVLLVTSGGPTFVERVAAAVGTQGLIEHAVTEDSEIWWIDSTHYRLVNRQIASHPYEIASSGARSARYLAAQNTIVHLNEPMSVCVMVPSPSGECKGVAESLRDAIAAGTARVVGQDEIDGKTIVNITTAIGGAADAETFSVDAHDFTPRRVTIHVGGKDTVVNFSTFEYLPPTQANLKLLDLETQHPTAIDVDHSPAP